MKQFNKTLLNKNLKQYIKSFELNHNYIKLNEEETSYYWDKILNTNNLYVINELKKKFRFMNSYITKVENKIYFIYDYYEKNFYNIYFYDLENINDNTYIEFKKEHLQLLKVIISIFLDNLKNANILGYKVRLSKNYINSKIFFSIFNKFKNNEFKVKKIKKEYYIFHRGNISKFYKKHMDEKYIYKSNNRLQVLSNLRNLDKPKI